MQWRHPPLTQIGLAKIPIMLSYHNGKSLPVPCLAEVSVVLMEVRSVERVVTDVTGLCYDVRTPVCGLYETMLVEALGLL